MKKVIITEDLKVFDGLYFDAGCTGPKWEGVVRFIFFNHCGKLKRAVLSFNPEFQVASADTSIIPASLRFENLFKYAGFLSPYGNGSNTVGSMIDLCNRCLGNYKFKLFENQEVGVKIIKQKIKENTFISPHYESKVVYTGQHGYHFSHGAIIHKPTTNKYKYRIGVELEVEALTEGYLERIRKFKSNWFFMERDGSLNDYGVEFVTIPLLPRDASNPKFWGELCGALSPIAKSWDSSHCGLHIHIGREILGKTEEERQQTLGKLLYLYHHFLKNTAINTKIFGRERGYHDLECKSELVKAVEILGTKVLRKKEMCDAIDDELKRKSRSERYFDINILNSATIEFRRGKGSLRPARIAAVVQYCELLCKYAKMIRWSHISYDDFIKYLVLKAEGPLAEIIGEF